MADEDPEDLEEQIKQAETELADLKTKGGEAADLQKKEAELADLKEKLKAQPDPKSLAEAKALIAKQQDALKAANREAADRRKKLKTFEEGEAKRLAEEKTRREAEMSEVEKAKARVADLEKQITDRDRQMAEVTIRTAVETAATKLKFHQPADAYALIDLATIEIEAGKVKGVDEALKAIIKAKPYLVDTGDGKGTPKPGDRRGNDGGREIKIPPIRL